MAAQDRTAITQLASKAGVVALCVVATALAGCGGSSTSSSSSSAATRTTVAGQTPGSSNAEAAGTTASTATAQTGTGRAATGQAAASAHGQHSVSPSGKVQRGVTTGPSDDGAANGAKALNPCTLVTRREAETITGRAVASSLEAPLGPTCIYEFAGTSAQVTLSVQSSKFSSIARQMAGRKALTVQGHSAYCGRLGLPALVLALPSGRLLNVTAPCRVATRFATVAVSRLPA